MSHYKPWPLVKAERLIRSGRIPLDDMRGYGAALKTLLFEYDRLQEQESDVALLMENYDRLLKVEQVLRTLINLRRNPGNVRGAENLEQVLWDELTRLTR